MERSSICDIFVSIKLLVGCSAQSHSSAAALSVFWINTLDILHINHPLMYHSTSKIASLCFQVYLAAQSELSEH